MTKQEREDMAVDRAFEEWNVERFVCPRCGHLERFAPYAPHGVYECRRCGWPGKARGAGR